MEQEKRGYLKASLWSGIANLIALFFFLTAFLITLQGVEAIP